MHDVQPAPADWTLDVDDVLTVEPGVYFNAPLLDAARNDPKQSPWIRWERVDQLVADRAGGVRIEDVVLVTAIADDTAAPTDTNTANGHQVLSARIPKEIHEIERNRQRRP